MSSTLFSTSCYIQTEPYNLRIRIDNNSNELSISTIDDILLILDSHESTSNVVSILNSIQLHLEPLNDKKRNSSDDDEVPEIIIFNKLFSIKEHKDVSNASNFSTVSPSSTLFSSQQNSKNHEVTLSDTSQIDLTYVDISESFVWSVKRIQLKMDPADAHQLCLISTQYLSKLKHRPRHLLVFVNPHCGKEEGCSVYEEKVLPLFEEANINVKTIYTERSNHARDYVTEQSLDNYDGLICVGGDGMFSELCHSLLLKTTQQAGLDIDHPHIQLKRPNLRIGVIPAGSTDAVAFGTTGHNDPITNALQIIIGESLLIDIATVHSERGFIRFMATMLAYGFFGNIIQQSDRWRFFGPLRYNLAGFFQFIRNTSYPTELTITQSSEKDSSKTSIDDVGQHSLNNSRKRRVTFDEKTLIKEKIASEETSLSQQIKRKGRYRTINCLNMPCRCEKSKYGMSPSVHLGDGSFDLILVKRSWRLDFLRFLHNVASDGRTVDELSNVERYRVTEVIIRPIVTRRNELGNWACDGELIKANEVKIRAHHQALNLFASGIRLDQVKKINDEESKGIPESILKRFYSTYRSTSWFLVLLCLFLLFLSFLFYYFFCL